ncbi:MAG: phosphatase PAP2 family protein [Chlorobi bacterium]|nr:phosphatase PAP2 family protein [Chlorobiota bacterium]
MISYLESLDTRLFLFLNGLHTPFFDQVMWYISAKLTWLPLYLFIFGWLYLIYRRRFWILFLFIILLVTTSDQVSVHAFKEVFHRLRPCHNASIQSVIHLVRNHCGGMYGFVSSHAANTFAVAVFSSLLIRNRTYTLFIVLWALLSGYSRIYLGVHYPGDVITGSLVGVATGYVVWYLWEITDRALTGRFPKLGGKSASVQKDPVS